MSSPSFLHSLQWIFAPSQVYLQRKFEDHRHFSAMLFFLFSVMGTLLWLWDRVTDPIGAQHTLGLRLCFLPLCLVTLGFIYSLDRRLLVVLSICSTLVCEAVFLVIITHLNQGMIYGLGGFMFFMLIGVLMFQSFSLPANIFYTIAAALMPHLLALTFSITEFEHAHYAALIWPASLCTAIAQVGFALNYLRRFLAEEELELASNSDPLTGASNRRHFNRVLAQERKRSGRLGEPYSLLMLDIDHFKRINDAYGHPTGDRVICILAQVCQQECRNVDLVARLGGEEFALLLPGTTVTQSLILAERIRVRVQALTTLSDKKESFPFTVSIGAAQFESSDLSDDEIIARADAALYVAKAGGRNRVCEGEPGKLVSV